MQDVSANKNSQFEQKDKMPAGQPQMLGNKGEYEKMEILREEKPQICV